MNGSGALRQTPLAIVGMACRLPGANNLDQYWEMLIQGGCAIGELPAEQFDQELYYDPTKGVRNKSYTRRGATIGDRQFDAERCPMAADLVRKADATHLLMCQVAVEALRQAGMNPLDLAIRNTGVYVGHTLGSGRAGDYAYAAGIEETAQCLREVESFRQLPANAQESVIQSLIAEVRGRFPRPTRDGPDLASHMAAGIVSKAFGLDGPFMAVNAACASSLQALLVAARSLQAGKIDMAVVGGASVCSTDWLVLFSAAQSMSDTQSRPFDADADGLIVAEGYVAVVVKTLQRAIADGDPIQAVIRGLGVASDGKGRSLWAPRTQGQIEAIRRAYGPGVEMADLQYIEAHSTATQLGDATEIASITEALKGAIPEGKKIPISSVKANIGHALESAGLASVIKTILCMQKGLIPPAINLTRLNPQIDWQKAPVCVLQETSPWPTPADGKPRRAGVNAFGIGGLNIHVVLDAYAGASPHGNGVSASLWPVAMPRDPDGDAVAIIGRGCVFAGARNVKDYWDLLQSARDPKQPTPQDRFAANGNGERRPGGFVGDICYDWRRHKIPPKQIEQADPLQFMVLDAADQALSDAGYDSKSFERKHTGIVVGTEFVGDFTFRLQSALRLPYTSKMLRAALVERGLSEQRALEVTEAFAEAFHTKWPVLFDDSGSFSASSLAVRVAKTWDLQGGASAVDSGATSAMAALNAAVDLLLAGDCNLMICAAAQRNLNCGLYESLAASGSLCAAGNPRGPFDRDGSGYAPGEGVGVLLLKRLNDARRDGDIIRGIVRGIGVAQDQSAYALSAAIQRSLERAQLRPGDLAFAITDASGVPASDAEIARAVVESQAASQRDEPLCIGSVVGQIGHTAGASGAASLLAATLAVEESVVPGVFGFHAPLPGIFRNGELVGCGNQATTIRPAMADGRLAGLVLSQDKGLAYSVVIERAAPVVAKPQSDAPTVCQTPERPTVAHRSTLRLVDAPLPAGYVPNFSPQGAVLILGENRPAEALRQRLESEGASVHHLLPSRGVDAVLAEMERLPPQPAIQTVFVMTGLDPGGAALRDPAQWALRRQQGIELPYLVLQQWRKQLDQSGNTSPCLLAAGTLLGGGLGLSTPVVAPEGGWIAGLLKSLDIEWNRRDRPTQVKVCDFGPDDSPAAIADAMLRELACERTEVEVALGQQRRRIVEAVESPITRLSDCGVQSGDTWILTGGARGITAEVAVKLGQDYDLDLHLIGRSAAPRDDAPWRNCSEDALRQIKRSIVRQSIAEGKSPEKQWERVKNDIEIHDNLQRMRHLGLRVTYHSCDVADWAALDATLREIRRIGGPITGIVHGAGYARSSRFESQKRGELALTLGAKVEGALALMHLTREDSLRYFVGFGSISGRYGGNGLTDYAAANEMLAKLCIWYATVRPDCAATCIDWQSWDEVGMAMLADSNIGARDVLGMKFIPPSEGVEHLSKELRAGLPEREVLIDDGEFQRVVRVAGLKERPAAASSDRPPQTVM